MLREATSPLLRRPITLALTLALATALGLFLVPAAWARGVMGVLLGLIAGIYVGFGLQGSSSQGALAEVAQAALFCGLALAGLVGAWTWLAVGLFAHAAWDLAHHRVGPLIRPPPGYALFCATYDVLLGGVVLLRFLPLETA